ncbi:MAG: hypothetical protein CEE43_03835 [Promethearchaeota archaeon Loki_b32]|nr:MAG: hypothetical protein CEE43_03835 [Candidatus Lokiarchaeota archaeon Loki_b32]
MDIQDFIKQLNQVQELMQKENYKEAISIIEKLKEIETESDYNYNLTHRLYQLDSNARSLFNQQKILKIINELYSSCDSISFQELNQVLNEKHKLNLSNDILQREIEILILRNLISCKIDREKLIF